ncbi:TetR/AcrR family transcriptional regulator [uncultured Ferrovibrio sp.]|jgi:Transcriptional regulator|uniref:TetR/AcrR family transcriptional regulator n=1 Tax=uncultured Ferrovibrio sp. TaxID=1576913 RepID=UPI0026278317|nr:TetR/AcrR family transcriptional regulator [uncultured Ferrovibrio sp.]
MARDAAATRTAIMDAAQELILQAGFSATSVDTVIAKAGLTKGAFFYHFKSKAELAHALVLRDAERDAAHLEELLARAETLSRDPLQQVLICIGLYEEEMAKLTAPFPGCLYASYCYEAQLFDDTTMDIVRRAFSDWAGRVAGKLRQVIALYPPRLPVTADGLAEMGLAVIEGAYILSKVNRDPKAVAAQFRHYRNYLELLFAPDLQQRKLDGQTAAA